MRKFSAAMAVVGIAFALQACPARDDGNAADEAAAANATSDAANAEAAAAADAANAAAANADAALGNADANASAAAEGVTEQGSTDH